MIRLSGIWKLYLIFTTVLIVTMTIAGFILQSQLKSRLQEHLKEDALVLAKVIGNVLPETERPSLLDSFCKNYADIADIRITIIKENGKVIGESDRKSIGIDNHLKRPEVKNAVSNEVGTTIRYSKTLKMDMFYVALLFKEKQKIIRVAIPMTEVKKIENKVMIFLAVALYLLPVLAIVISFFFARYFLSTNE